MRRGKLSVNDLRTVKGWRFVLLSCRLGCPCLWCHVDMQGWAANCREPSPGYSEEANYTASVLEECTGCSEPTALRLSLSLGHRLSLTVSLHTYLCHATALAL